MTRVVVTGIGVITSIGSGKEAFWESLLAGRIGIHPVTSFNTEAYNVHCGGEVSNFSIQEYAPELDPESLGRASQFGVAAAKLAVEDADLNIDALNPLRTGVSMGTTSGEPNLIEQFNDRYIHQEGDEIGAKTVWQYPCHLIAGHIAEALHFQGINTMIPSACAAGNYAIAHAFDILRSGRADVMLAGASDTFSRITYSGFAQLKAIAPEQCQPFDKNRKGMIPGEGRGVLVLEPLKRARARNARIYAEIAGYGLSCDAFHMTGGHPEDDGATRAMVQALRESRTRPEDISYISAHGTGTRTNDAHETAAVKRVFQDAAYRIPISSIKSMLGHTWVRLRP